MEKRQKQQQQSPTQQKNYNGGYPVYDNTRFVPYALRENANHYVSIDDTKTQVSTE